MADIHEELQNVVKDKELDIADLPSLVSIAMEIIENHNDLNGSTKKVKVLEAIKRVIDISNKDNETKMNLQNIASTILSGFIDIIISASKGDLKLNMKETFDEVKELASDVKDKVEENVEDVEEKIGTKCLPFFNKLKSCFNKNKDNKNKI